ncbi:hypothetical protein NDU88_001633 [Pleurodeles waltl]|uniref:Uncharacterized protein n=1 Tax=Pleurodeles waltl TaxID=8319 RepID=A0AAV7UTC3_PLEWA|nr:hypothetical protein NDU88_001633 [Pleurodeles waltl]
MCGVRTQEDAGARSKVGAEEEWSIAAAAVVCRSSGISVSRGIVAEALVPPQSAKGKKRAASGGGEKDAINRGRGGAARKTPQGATM